MKRILLFVDDDPEDHDILRHYLYQYDYNVELISALNWNGALETLSTHTPDWIFLDINMPKLNGIELLRKLRSAEEYRKIPVYIYSTSQEHTSKLIALAEGATAYFKKPSSRKEFEKIFEDVFLRSEN